jgi:hypothetical protein
MREDEPALFEISGECGIGGRQQEEHEGRRHHVMREARHGGFFRADAAADHRDPFEDENLLALAGEKGGATSALMPLPAIT